MANIQEQIIKELDLKVGDYVKVVSTSPDRHLGWQNSWVHQMNGYVGKSGKITKISHNGVEILFPDGCEKYDYPAHVLVKVEAPIPEVKLNDNYTAKIYKNKVEVGCQEFPISKIREILKLHDEHF